MKVSVTFRLIIIALALVVVTSCTKWQPSSVADSDGYNLADTIISDIGDARDFPRLIEVTDSFERIGEIPPVRAIFYKTISCSYLRVIDILCFFKCLSMQILWKFTIFAPKSA